MALASAPDPAELSLQQAAELYLSCGMSVIPCISGDKQPNYGLLRPADGGPATWERYQHNPPTPLVVGHWLRLDEDTNIGIVCGAVSGNLVVLDIDDPDLSQWLSANMQHLLAKTWTVRTGSGKLHIYLRSNQSIGSTILRHSDGRKLMDVRSNGEYVVAPPSMHTSGQLYRNEYGAPTKVIRLHDVLGQARQLVSMFEAGQVRITRAAGKSSSGVVPELDHDQKREMLRRLASLSVSERVRRAIVYGYTPGVKPWEKCPSASECDFAVLASLRSAGLSRTECHIIFASFPIGEITYRNEERPHHGYSYLEASLVNVDEKQLEETRDSTQAAGENFSIERVIRLMGDPPSYELWLLDTASNEQGRVLVRFEELMTEKQFCYAVLRQLPRLLPVLRNAHSGKNWHVFVSLLARIAELEAVPDNATATGHLRATIIGLLKDWRIQSVPPQDKGDFTLGWRDTTQGLVYFRGTRLLNDLGMLLRQQPAPDKVWEVIRKLGGQHKRVKIGPDQESLWILPAKTLDFK